MAPRLVLPVLLGARLAASNMYDVTNVPRAAPAICGAAGCARWSALAEDGHTGVTQAAADARWVAGKAPEDAGSGCAMPGIAAAEESRMPSSGFLGAWCYCKSSELSGYCQAGEAIPEQINLQIASADTVVVAFVTYEATQSATPFVMWGQDESSLTKTTGVTHHYMLPAVNPDPGGGIPPTPPLAAEMAPDLRAKEARTEAFVVAHANGTAFEGMGGSGARRLQDNEGAEEAAAAAIGSPVALTVSNSSFCSTGDKSVVTVGWTGITKPDKKDQIALWCPHNSTGMYFGNIYSWTPCKTGGACTSSGAVEFGPSLLAKVPVGETCEFRYCRNDDDYCGPAKPANFAAVSAPVEQHGFGSGCPPAPPALALTVSNSSFCWTGADSSVSVSWSNITKPGDKDQIGLWCPHNSTGEMITYSWLPCKYGGNCTSSGEIGFDRTQLAKVPAGESCEFRYCRDDDNFCGPAKPANFAAVSEPVGIGSSCKKPDGRQYQMHFVKLTGLQPRGKYKYKVSSGTPDAVTSDLFTFTAPYASGVTKLGIFGDMGVFEYNNMGNLLDDYTAGKIDLIVHMGDHAYDMEDGSSERGDGYMNAYSKVLTSCPWMPVVGASI